MFRLNKFTLVKLTGPFSLTSSSLSLSLSLSNVKVQTLSLSPAHLKFLSPPNTFTAGGYSWAIYFYRMARMASEGADVRALFELKLLDQSEKKMHKVYSQFSRPPDSGPYTIRNRGIMW